MIAHLKWSTPAVSGTAPATKNHTATLVGDELFVFGGYDGTRNHAALHVLDLISWTWRNNVSCRGTPPSGRNGHSATLIPPLKKHSRGGRAYCEGAHNGHRLILVLGGWLGTGPYAARDAHVLDADAKEWLCTSEPSVAPGLHSVQLLVPGVRNATPADSKNLAADDTNSGSDDDDSSMTRGSGRQVILGAGPGPCNMHTADWVPHRRQVLVFRGGDGRQYLNDLHALSVGTDDIDDVLGDGATWQWDPLPTIGQSPRPRANHSSCVADRSLFVFGGWDGAQRLNDVHVLNTETLCWTEVAVANVLSHNPLRSPPNLAPSETPAPATTTAGDAASVEDAPVGSDAELVANSNTNSKAPQPRAGMSLTSLHGLLFLFGGSGPGSCCFGDLQVLDPDAPLWVDTSTAAAAAAAATATPEGLSAQDSASIASATAGGNIGASTSRAAGPTNGLRLPSSSNAGAANPNDGAPPPHSTTRHRNSHHNSRIDSDHFDVLDDGSGGDMGALGLRNWRLKSERQRYGLNKMIIHGSHREQRSKKTNLIRGGINTNKNSDNTGPGRRAGHSTTVCSDARRLIIFGGSLGNEYLNDVHVLDTDPLPSSSCFDSWLKGTAPTSPSSKSINARNIAPARSLAQQLKQFVNASDFSDVVFVVEGQQLFAHRLILAATSERFAASFRQARPSSSYSATSGSAITHGGFAESSSAMQEVMVPHHSYACFAMMLDYLYTGETPLVLRSRQLVGNGIDDNSDTSDEDFDEKDCDIVPPNLATSEDTTVIGSGKGEEREGSGGPVDVNCAPFKLVCGSEHYEQAVELLAMGDEYMLEHLKVLAERALVRNCLEPLLRQPVSRSSFSSHSTTARHEDNSVSPSVQCDQPRLNPSEDIEREERGRGGETRKKKNSVDNEEISSEGERLLRTDGDRISADPVHAVANELLKLSECTNAQQLKASAAHALRNAGNARRVRLTRRRRPNENSM